MSATIQVPAATALPAWPPALTPDQLRALASAGTDYALAHGLVYRPLPASKSSGATTAPPTDSVIHAPCSLLPSPFPRALFERAHGPIHHGQQQPASLPPISSKAQAHSLPALYAHLYAALTLDHDFLTRVIGAEVARVDEFQGELWRRYLAVREELLREGSDKSATRIGHRLHLGLFRSDYLLHSPSPSLSNIDVDSGTGKETALELKQVEFNTISASFGALSTRAAEMHRFVHASTGAYFGAAPQYLGAGPIEAADGQGSAALPPNRALQTLAAGLAAGHQAYVRAGTTTTTGSSSQFTTPAAPAILFVVQPGERNAFDQRWLEYELLAAHGVRVLRATFDELAGVGVSGGSTKTGSSWGANLVGEDRTLRVRLSGHSSLSSSSPSDEGVEISVVYFRAGYGPGDYPPNSPAWDMRTLLERSNAIKCPTMALQLAGAKKVQQVLAEPGVLESFLLPSAPSTTDDAARGSKKGTAVYTHEDVALLRSTFSGLWPLDSRSELGREGLRLARAEPARFVLKPQREGGGNNVYRHDIPAFLDKLAEEHGPGAEEGYILMELIQPPSGVGNYLMRAGAGLEEGPQLAPDVVSELGIYSTALFGPATLRGGGSAGLDMVHEGYGGYLLRTKGRESDEGGVAVGYSVIDSVVLV